jgi:FtsP/CotA-like multicopper oxidase with cupredoxin domain
LPPNFSDNGQFPGPLLRFTEGKRAIIDIYNNTDIPEVALWHGQMIPSEVDGAIVEGTPVIPPHGMRRISFVPKPSGFLVTLPLHRPQSMGRSIARLSPWSR